MLLLSTLDQGMTRYNNFCPWQLQLSGEELHSVSERDSEGGGSGGSDTACPLTARSLRLERAVQALAHSQEELRRYVTRKKNRKFSATVSASFLKNWKSFAITDHLQVWEYFIRTFFHADFQIFQKRTDDQFFLSVNFLIFLQKFIKNSQFSIFPNKNRHSIRSWSRK